MTEIKTNGKITIGNVLQTVIIVLLSLLGWLFGQGRADIRQVSTDVKELTEEFSNIKVDQAIIRYEIGKNTTDHIEIKGIIKDLHK